MMDAAQSTQKLTQNLSDLGRLYLSFGGPTSRAENLISECASVNQLEANAYATATGLFVTVTSENEMETQVTRIPHQGICFDALIEIERNLQTFFAGEINFESLILGLKSIQSKTIKYSSILQVLSAFLIGFGASASAFGAGKHAVISGFLTVVIFGVSKVLGNTQSLGVFFADFLSSVITFGVAGISLIFMGTSVPSTSIGALVFLVPGLTLTNAISELAQSNYVSGSSKLMKGILTLLAMGTAFTLITDIIIVAGFSPSLFSIDYGSHVNSESPASFLIRSGFMVLTLLGFSILFHVPKSLLFVTTAVGLTGWSCVHLFSLPQTEILSPFLAALSVGLISYALGTYWKIPSQVFSVPGILSLLPGLLAFSSFGAISKNSNIYSSDIGARVALTATAIVFGLFTAKLPFILLFKKNKTTPEVIQF